LNDDLNMPFGNEADEVLRSEPRGFAPEQMVPCTVCLRANPPTRATCLYCAAPLPATTANVELRRPTLRQLEKWEQGFNVILLPEENNFIDEESLLKVSELLRLSVEDFKRISKAGVALPLARAATIEEATLIEQQLKAHGIKEVLVLADEALGGERDFSKRVRALEFSENELLLFPRGGGEVLRCAWREVALMVAGRHYVRQIEVEERKGRGAENEMLDAREMSADEALLDLYTTRDGSGWRIGANNFDFSCLGNEKRLLATENFALLIETLRTRATEAEYDDTYRSVRHALKAVWMLEQTTASQGLRRGSRPGRYNTEAVTTSDNETQFTRYSRLRHYLKLRGTGTEP
jgi:hypothetical protein